MRTSRDYGACADTITSNHGRTHRCLRIARHEGRHRSVSGHRWTHDPRYKGKLPRMRRRFGKVGHSR